MYTVALPLAYSIRYCQAYGLLSINLLDSHRLSSDLLRSVLLSNSFKALLPTAYIVRCCQAFVIWRTLLLGLWTHSAHCHQAQGLLPKMLPGHGLYCTLPPDLWPDRVRSCQAYGPFSSRLLGSSLLSSGRINCDLLGSVRLHSSLLPVA